MCQQILRHRSHCHNPHPMSLPAMPQSAILSPLPAQAIPGPNSIGTNQHWQGLTRRCSTSRITRRLRWRHSGSVVGKMWRCMHLSRGVAPGCLCAERAMSERESAALVILRLAAEKGLIPPQSADEWRAKARELPPARATVAWLVEQGVLTGLQVDELRAAYDTVVSSSAKTHQVLPVAEPQATQIEELPTLQEPKAHRARTAVEAVPRVEGYEVLSRLGEGGMGVVYRAVQLSTRREVALKLLAAHAFVSAKARQRFEREVELAARLEHPNIARIYDSGVCHSICYYSMEFIDGLPLDRYVEVHKLARGQILDLMRVVCGAVHHAHQHGVVHRDLKPSNVLVTPDGQPHVLDFGLAKALEADEADRARLMLSVEGQISGTPAFMAPEQAAGQTDRVGVRSDVYSLGVILFRLLTGEYPHDMSGNALDLLRRITEEDVRRPRDVTNAVDRELEAVLLKATVREPAARYATAGELAQDLDNYLNGRPLSVRPPGMIFSARRFMRRHAVPVGVVAVALVVAGLRWGGLLEGLELRAYDAFLGLAVLPASAEPPITLIGVNEQDIKALGHYPLTDEEVAALLADVVARGARAVGLDIYRDIEVGPGRARLNAVLMANPEVMAVMQVGAPDTAAAPPAVLKDSDRVGFADQVVDGDGVIRRCLMFMSSDEQTYYSLALRVALAYLEPMGIVPQADKRNPAYMRLGRVTICRFGPYDGPYVRADAGGYQFLLDYRGPRRFPTFSLSDVRGGRVPDDALKDRIVLIGVTAESMKDYVNVPGRPNLHGVEMEAICVDQLLRIALDGRQPMRVLGEWQEALWIVGVIALGGLLGTWAQSLGTFLLVGAAGLGAIVFMAFVVFCLGWWMPVVPAGAGWLGAWLLAGPYRPRKRKLT